MIGLNILSENGCLRHCYKYLTPELPILENFYFLLQPALDFDWDVIMFDRPTNMINWMGASIVLAAIYISMSQSTPKASTELQETRCR